MTITFGNDPVRTEVASILEDLENGVPREKWESKHVDLKEEAGRRDRFGAIRPGSAKSEEVATQLLFECACMANTPGGGALIVGVSDTGELIGAETDAEWLRHRIYEKSDRRLTVEVSEAFVNSVNDVNSVNGREGELDTAKRRYRLLVILAMESLEPIQVNKHIHWRVDDHCVEIDASTWHQRRVRGLGFDWSAQPTAVPITAARAQALEVARDFLMESGEESAADLAKANDRQLLSRLNVTTHDGFLTNAGVLMFVGRDTPCIDYIRREFNGGDTLARVNRARSLLEELVDVFTIMGAHIHTRQVMTGIQVINIRELPLRAAREAVVNGMAHRDWGTSAPTVVEHIGRTLRVTSPGGFVGGVNSSNILTHPSTSRNTSLAQLLADLRIAEREGVGVDRMTGDMIRVGHEPPTIMEIDGPFVRATLLGDAIDIPWTRWLSLLSPAHSAHDVNALLILQHLKAKGWVDTERAAKIIQAPESEAITFLKTLSKVELNGHPVVERVHGAPETLSQSWTFTATAADALRQLDTEESHQRRWPTRREIAISYAHARGRISSTELAAITHSHPSNAGRDLKALFTEGMLEASTSAHAGRGFYYTWARAEMMRPEMAQPEMAQPEN